MKKTINMKRKVTKGSKSGPTIKQKIKAIRVSLRRGDIGVIASRLDYDQSHVSRVLRGERNNEEIVNYAYASLNKRKVNS